MMLTIIEKVPFSKLFQINIFGGYSLLSYKRAYKNTDVLKMHFKCIYTWAYCMYSTICTCELHIYPPDSHVQLKFNTNFY